MTPARHSSRLAVVRKTPVRLLLALALLAGLGWGAYGLWGRRPLPPPAKPQAPATHAMEGLSLTEVQDGVKRWVLEANTADYRKDRNEIFLTGIYLEFYGEDDRVINLTSQEGRVDTKTRAVTLQNQVEISQGDLRITTDLVRYLPQERLLVAPHAVVLENPRLRVQGSQLTVFLAAKRLVLAQHRLTEVLMGEEFRP